MSSFFDANQRIISEQSVYWSEELSFVTEEFMDKLVLGVAALALSAGVASAQGYGYGYGYAGAPLYDYATRLRDTATQRQPMQHRPLRERPLLL